MTSDISPLFLCGVGRSGTSYLLKLLNNTSKIHLSFEGRMLKEGITLWSNSSINSFSDFSKFLDNLCRSESETRRNKELIEVACNSREQLYDFYLAHRNYANLMHHIYSIAYHKPFWGDKLLRIEYAWRILEVWPQAKFIILYRDPRAIFLSQKEKWGSTIPYVAGYWNTHFEIGEQLKERLPEQTHQIYYEQLIESPQSTFESLLDFVEDGLSKEAGNVLALYPPNHSPLKKWRRSLSEDEIRSIESYTYSKMIDLGYEPLVATTETDLLRIHYLISLFELHSHYLFQPKKIIRKNLLRRLITMLKHSN